MSMAMTGRAAGPILSRGRRAPAVKMPKGTVTNALGSTLRQLAQSDARMYRELADIAKPKPKRMGGSKSRKRLKGG
jgi:hypothetical protein